MSKWRIPQRIGYLALYCFCANSFVLCKSSLLWLIPALLAFLFVNLSLGFYDLTVKSFRNKVLYHGTEALVVFLLSAVLSGAFHIILLLISFDEWLLVLWSVPVSYIAHLILFWNGIISVYLTSVQLGIKTRVIGLICGPIPIAHLFALRSIIRICKREVEVENAKDIVNRKRAKEKICKTKYPVLLVHGVFFRDSKHLNYWGRIPAELLKNGATVYYGNHQSALSVADSASELADRIRKIVEKTGCEKVNVIAHSKGGLDTRYAIAKLGIGPMVASLTTINTPHRGCNFADHLLSKLGEGIKDKAARAYNRAARVMGDKQPDFMAAVSDLTAERCSVYDKELTVPEDIFCQSVGSVLKKRTGGRFPLNVSYPMVKKHDGENDSLVSVDSFSFGESCRILSNEKDRGISHGDMIDLNRENIDGFDVREFYVELLSELREKGF